MQRAQDLPHPSHPRVCPVEATTRLWSLALPGPKGSGSLTTEGGAERRNERDDDRPVGTGERTAGGGVGHPRPSVHCTPSRGARVVTQARDSLRSKIRRLTSLPTRENNEKHGHCPGCSACRSPCQFVRQDRFRPRRKTNGIHQEDKKKHKTSTNNYPRHDAHQ